MLSLMGLLLTSCWAVQLWCVNKNLRSGLVIRGVNQASFLCDHYLVLLTCDVMDLRDLLHLEWVLDLCEVGGVAHAWMVMPLLLSVVVTAMIVLLMLLFSVLTILLRDERAGGRLVLVLVIRLDGSTSGFRSTAVGVAVVRLDLWGGSTSLLLVNTTYTDCWRLAVLDLSLTAAMDLDKAVFVLHTLVLLLSVLPRLWHLMILA